MTRAGVDDVAVVPLGVELDEFEPSRRDMELRRSLGVGDDQPMLIYAGRLDGEKRPDVVVDAFRQLPDGDGRDLGAARRRPAARAISRTGQGDAAGRAGLRQWTAPSWRAGWRRADIYVSAMADETFGISVIEAQASGLPVVGVAAGAMVDRVTRGDGPARPGR